MADDADTYIQLPGGRIAWVEVTLPDLVLTLGNVDATQVRLEFRDLGQPVSIDLPAAIGRMSVEKFVQ